MKRNNEKHITKLEDRIKYLEKALAKEQSVKDLKQIADLFKCVNVFFRDERTGEMFDVGFIGNRTSLDRWFIDSNCADLVFFSAKGYSLTFVKRYKNPPEDG